MNPPCARCTKTVYPVEALKCLDQVWHKACFKCDTCSMTLNMKNYKGYSKRPYCSAHYPITKFTAVAETPENLRLKQQSQIQSQANYHKDFEESKGKYTAVADDPETLRMKELKDKISLVEYHKDFETSKGTKISTAMDPETERVLKNSQISSQAAYHGVREQRQEQERRRSEIDFDHDYDVQQQQQQQHHLQQQSRRPPGKIADYDPNHHQVQKPPVKDNTPYSSRGQARVVYSTSENTDFGTLLGYQKVQKPDTSTLPRKVSYEQDTNTIPRKVSYEQDTNTIPRKVSYEQDADDVELRRHGSTDSQQRNSSTSQQQRNSSTSSGDRHSTKYEDRKSVDDDNKPVFVPYVPPEQAAPAPPKSTVTKFRVNTGFEKLKSEARLENGQLEGNNNRISLDEKFQGDIKESSDFHAPDPYAPPDNVMPSTLPSRSPNRSGGNSPPAEGRNNGYQVQVEVKYQRQDHNNHGGGEGGGSGGSTPQRERGYSTPDTLYSGPHTRSYDDYDLQNKSGGGGGGVHGGALNPPQMNYSQTLPRGNSRGLTRDAKKTNQYDPRIQEEPRNMDPRNDPSMYDDRRGSDPRNEPSVFDDRRGSEPRNDPRIDPRNDPRYDPRSDPRSDPRYDPRIDPRNDPRYDPRDDPRMDPRYDPRIDPRDPKNDPRTDPRMQNPRIREGYDDRHQHRQPQQASPGNYTQTLPSRKGRNAPDPYEYQYQAPRRTPSEMDMYGAPMPPLPPLPPLPQEAQPFYGPPPVHYGAPPSHVPPPMGARPPPVNPYDDAQSLRGSGEHGSQASLGSIDSGGSGQRRRERKARQPYYRALYDYSAADDDEISFNEGDAIVDVVPIDQGWMEGRVKRTGEYGMLPANYVELVQ